MKRTCLLVALAACGRSAAGPEPLHNVAPPTLAIPPSQPLGDLGLAPALADSSEVPSYVPVHATYPLVQTPAGAGTFTEPRRAIGTSGGVSAYQPAAAATEIPFGCDGNTLSVRPYSGARMPPGVVWILPPGAPSAWQPEALSIRVTGSGPANARFAVGPLTVELERTTPRTGLLSIRRAGPAIHREPFERSAMDGAPPELDTIDLAARDLPGIPTPVAAWSIVPGGPILLVLHTPGWEGSTLSGLLVEDASARADESLIAYLYRCAF